MNTLCIQSCCVDQTDLQCTEIGLPLPPGCLDYSCVPLFPTHFRSSPTTVMIPTGQPACRVALGPVLCSTLSQTQLMLRTTHFGGIIMMFFVQEKKLRHRGQRNAHGVSVKSYQQLGWRIVSGICVLSGLHALRSVCSWVCILPSFLTAVLLCLTGFLMIFISTGWHTQEKMIITLSWRSYEGVAEEMPRWLRELAILESTVSFRTHMEADNIL